MLQNFHFKADDIVIYEKKIIENIGRDKSRELLLRAADNYANMRGIAAADFTLSASELGKPFFANMQSVHFSISHSGSYWACAFHGEPLGFDIQEHSAGDYLKIAKRFFHPDEYAALQSCRGNTFFVIWSAKESYIKYTGRGLAQPLDSFSTLSPLHKTTEGEARRRLVLQKVPFYAGYSSHICAASPADYYRIRCF